jgi:hypothetical protein
MRREEYLQWFEDLLRRFESVRVNRGDDQRWYDEEKANEWITEAGAAIAAVFAHSHPSRQAWATHIENLSAGACSLCTPLIGVFKGATNQLRDGRLGTLIETIRAESASEFLEQAECLLASGYLAASTVIAGGVLESELRHLIDKHGITHTGSGSISVYNGAVGQARNAGQVIYSANDGKLVEAWGGLRNEAAHNPGTFARSNDEVRRMIEGIREFLARISI